LYWAEAAAAQTKDGVLQSTFDQVAKEMRANEQVIVDELIAAQGDPQDVGGYYQPDPALAGKAMRPSVTLNRIIDGISA
jgi:isocitrate dehydrogenase